ncbi:acetyl-CoA carboxylase biotin carboxylase subunit [bacterium]|nr:acetyl-CoA carboxylase biotin carboxylase subunit [bacterium]
MTAFRRITLKRAPRPSRIKSLLVANRGEIAVRIIRACWELGIRCVLAASETDKDSLPARLADEVVTLGDGLAGETYLSMDRILAVAREAKVQGIHPGYGFLSENPVFSRRCKEEGFVFIGPDAGAMEKLGDKVWAKRKARELKIPVVPGSANVIESVEEATRVARRIGMPVLIKAAAGGGGRGMRVVRKAKDLAQGYAQAQAEALAAFGSGACFLERYLDRPRHVEIQILADKRGRVIHLFDRECTIQRRHQKLLEECPALALSPWMRKRMSDASKALVKSANYHGPCTVEFLVQGHNFYFIECNTRIQVEHPVTEMVTGVDIVRAGIRIAGGERLPLTQMQLRRTGHAIECRINAEDPARGFAPTPGRVEELVLPSGPGIRVDTHLCHGYVVPQIYDSLVAKIIAHGRTRKEAINRMERALRETVIRGFPTTLPFHRRLLTHKTFRAGKVWTGFVDSVGSRITAPGPEERIEALIAAAVLLADEETRPALNGERVTGSAWGRAAREEAVRPWT